MPCIELAFVVVCVVAVLQAIGSRVPVPMAVLQIAAGVGLSAFAMLSDLREQSALLFVMLVPPVAFKVAVVACVTPEFFRVKAAASPLIISVGGLVFGTESACVERSTIRVKHPCGPATWAIRGPENKHLV